ncbi:Bax inhibitor-1/YccA family protein [Actinomyces mediterranea]|uniref:Bax inhibitor-1/YccA family protein n=1 Tax=Actinomyces mediterranea TaxID=1871028 RepID=UPI000970D6A6|nr:Bax inhibitor-1/YccA family protein [Actinomyces mediterranea]
MSNPVFNKLETEWTQQRTPNGYPTMPGYQVGTAGQNSPYAGGSYDPRNPYGAASQAATGAQAADQAYYQQMEAAYAAPAADAVDRGVMTYDDVIMKTGISLGVLLIGGVVSWTAVAAAPTLGMMLSVVGIIGGFILAMVNSFSKTIRPALILAYAGFEGLALGAISATFEFIYPGIVIQAVLATAAVFGVTLALFASGKIRNSSKLMRFTLIALVGIIIYRLASWILTLTGVLTAGGFDSITIMGFPLGLVVGVVAVFVGAACLIQDFDQAKTGVARGVPAVYAWACAFGILVTVVWMYLEILRIIAAFRNS